MGFLSSIGKAIGGVAKAVSPVGDILGVASAASGLFGGAADDQRDFASAQAAQANAFTKEQLQKRHQWEVADLRKAGLNPILSAMKGAPSIGGSAQAVSQANAAQDAAATVSSAAQARAQRLNEERLQAEIDLLKSQSYNQRQQGKNAGATGDIKTPLANIASGFHGASSSAAKTISKNLDELKNFPQLFKDAIKRNKEKRVYNWDRYKFWKKKGK